MWIAAKISGRFYGGYQCQDVSVAIDYEIGRRGRSAIDFYSYPKYARELRRILVGKRAPREVRIRGMGIIVRLGEIITRAHIRIIEMWFSEVSFGRTRIGRQIMELKRQYAAELDPAETIRVKFTYDSIAEQEGGEFVVSVPVARRLGKQLLAFADGKTTAPVHLNVKADRRIAKGTREQERTPQSREQSRYR